MQIYSHMSRFSGEEALEEELDSKIEENLEGQSEITAEKVKSAWLAYNDYSDYLMADGDEFDVDITSFNNSVYGHFLSQFPMISL
jgi:hypothetical protein